MLESTCPNCGATGIQHYCPNCGQAAPSPDDFRLRHFFREVFASITSLESRFAQTIFSLIAKPGQLTRDYFDGKRQRYLKPVQLFVLCNVFYFLTQTVQQMNTLTTPVQSQISSQLFSDVANSVWQSVKPANPESLIKRLDPWMADQAKTLVFLLVGIYALMLWPVLTRKKMAYAQHLVFAVHLFSFVLLVLPVVYVLHQWFPSIPSDAMLAVIFAVYLWRSDVVAYALRPFAATRLTLYQLAALFISISAYRLLLFLIALAWHRTLF